MCHSSGHTALLVSARAQLQGDGAEGSAGVGEVEAKGICSEARV